MAETGLKSLYRDAFETNFVVKDESCWQCGIACHKNIYEAVPEKGKRKAGKFYTKFDYEPLDLLTVNLGIYDQHQALEIVELVDQLGFDSISMGVTLGYVMEYNARHPDKPIFDGMTFGDFEKARHFIHETAAGRAPEIGCGVKRLAASLGDTAYAMECKGLELPAYLPETNPGYPFAMAGGHMSMRTFLLLVFEGKTDLDYWEDAVVNRGFTIRVTILSGSASLPAHLMNILSLRSSISTVYSSRKKTCFTPPCGPISKYHARAPPGDYDRRLCPPRASIHAESSRQTAPFHHPRVLDGAAKTCF